MNVKKIVGTALIAGAITISSIGSANATATYDPDAQTGFVGKGDVQLAFGWNNKQLQLQSNASAVDFVHENVTEYDVTCDAHVTETFTNPAGRPVTRRIKVTNIVSSDTAVSYDSKTATKTNPNGAIVGFNISGIDRVLEAQSAPAVGDTCPMDDGTQGKVSAVEKASSSDTLYATHSSKPSAPVWVDGESVY